MKNEYDLIPADSPLLRKIFKIIYLSDTRPGKMFDLILLFLILASTLTVILQSEPLLETQYHATFYLIECCITVLFTVEYVLRILSVKDKWDYILSPLGILDLISIGTFYISIFFPEMHYLVIVRMLRLLRVFRILGLNDFQNDGRQIVYSLKRSSRKILVFLLFLCIFIVIIGGMMYIIEGGKNGFHSIPQGIYWAVVTITTVGYGDISPTTAFGKFLSIIVMLAGYSIIAVPTGLMASEINRPNKNRQTCTRCGEQEHEGDARFCKRCGEKLIV